MAPPNSYNTTTLVSNIQLISHVPLSNSTFNASQIITLADRELQTAIIAQITSIREGYYLQYVDISNNQSGIYDLPEQSIGGAVVGVQLQSNNSLIPINRLEPLEQFSTTAPTSTSYGFYFRGNKLVVLPVPTYGNIRIWFLRRTNALVATSAAANITAINGNIITVSSLPSTFAVGTSVDLCQDQPPFDMLGNTTISAISGLDVTLADTIDNLSVYDWLCLENQTPVPQIPVEFRPLLEQRVAVKIYELQGYMEKMKMAGDTLKKMEGDLFKLISPRIQSQTRIVNPQNGGFINNAGRFASLFWTRN